MTKNNKRYYYEALSKIIAANPEIFAEVEDMSDFVSHELELLNKRNEKRINTRNAEVDAIYNVLAEAGTPLTAIAIIKNYPAYEDLSTQKIAALIAPLVDAGKVVKTKTDKGTAYSLPTAD